MLAGKLCVVHYSYWIKADSKIVFIRWNREERDGFSFYIMLHKALTSKVLDAFEFSQKPIVTSFLPHKVFHHLYIVHIFIQFLILMEDEAKFHPP